jgi:hypothetical protein
MSSLIILEPVVSIDDGRNIFADHSGHQACSFLRGRVRYVAAMSFKWPLIVHLHRFSTHRYNVSLECHKMADEISLNTGLLAPGMTRVTFADH